MPAVRGQRVSDVLEADRRVGRSEASEGGWGFAEVGGEEGQGDRVYGAQVERDGTQFVVRVEPLKLLPVGL
jgi:hypothetical protein